MEKPIWDSRAYANKELLKEDLSLRIAESINSAGVLYEALAFAPQRIQEVKPDFDIEEVEAEIVTSEGVVKDMLKKKVESAKKRMGESERKIVRIVDPTAYKPFLIDFYKLWIESKDSVKKWATNKTEEEITNLFALMMSGELDAGNPNIYSGTLLLFEDYMKTLAESGVIDFKTKTFKTGLKLLGGK